MENTKEAQYCNSIPPYKENCKCNCHATGCSITGKECDCENRLNCSCSCHNCISCQCHIDNPSSKCNCECHDRSYQENTEKCGCQDIVRCDNRKCGLDGPCTEDCRCACHYILCFVDDCHCKKCECHYNDDGEYIGGNFYRIN